MLALIDHHLLDLGGTYGDPQAGEPIQCDELRIEHDQGVVEIVVYNRAILVFGTDTTRLTAYGELGPVNRSTSWQ